ncbi:hypothetical protein NDU88_000877 [Pleurodeles waltl]|uniref:Uncharacterized protein n=1 Tax=Pleurodeles waltl TaxID=8319 RepID=A0AAV7V686_PLEWA|nr:hypothetical protein NDU88_000877 [Pleurodeles waltl]
MYQGVHAINNRPWLLIERLECYLDTLKLAGAFIRPDSLTRQTCLASVLGRSPAQQCKCSECLSSALLRHSAPDRSSWHLLGILCVHAGRVGSRGARVGETRVFGEIITPHCLSQ